MLLVPSGTASQSTERACSIQARARAADTPAASATRSGDAAPKSEIVSRPASWRRPAKTGPIPSISLTLLSPTRIGVTARKCGDSGSRDAATEMNRSRMAQRIAIAPPMIPSSFAARFMATKATRSASPPNLAFMKVDFWYSGAPEVAAEAAQRAKSIGFDGFFTAETQHDPFLPLAVASSVGADLELGTGIAVAFPRSPMAMAMVAWDLARMSRGRFMLGLGTQVRAHITRRFSTAWDKPGPRLRDYILSMRAIWDAWQQSTPLRYDGEFYQFSLMTPFFDPGPINHPDVPVYIAGVGPYLSRMAGEICDGFHVHPFHTARYLDDVVLPQIEEGAEAGGRTLGDVERVTALFVATGESQAELEQAMEPIRQQISFYGSTPSYAPIFEAEDWDFNGELRAMSRRGEWDKMIGVVPDEAVEAVAVIAPIEKLGEAIRDRCTGRLQRVGFYALGNVMSLDPDAQSEVIRQIRS